MTRGGKRPGAGRPQINPKEALLHVLRVSSCEKDFIQFARLKKIDLIKLKKTLLVIFFLFIFAMPANAYTLKGGVEYTVDTARIAAFENISPEIPLSEIKHYLRDMFYFSNIEALNQGKLIAGLGFKRKLVPFYNKNKKLSFYGVQTEDEPEKKLYYSTSGRLLKYEINTFKGTYPYRTVAYDTKGRLISINFAVSENEAFIFDKNKKLIGHWIGNQCFDENGQKTITRRL